MPKRPKKEAEVSRPNPAEEEDLHVPEQIESSDAESEDEPEAAGNGLEDSDDGSLDSDDEEVQEALQDYVAAAAANRDAGEAGPSKAEDAEQ